MSTARNDQVTLFYEVFGDQSATPLLLVNGLGSQCINYKTEWCERFVAGGFRVIRFDNRDVGLSTMFDDFTPDVAAVAKALSAKEPPPVPYTIWDMADDAVAVLDAAGVDRAHVFGVSMGGMIVQALAIAHSDRLLSMTSVMSSTGDRDVGQSTPEAMALMMAPPASDRDTYIERHLQGIKTWGSPACYDEARLTKDAGEAYDRCFNPAGRTRQMIAIMASGSRSAALKNTRVPALVLHGDADNLVNPTGGQRTAEVIPGARFVLIPGMGHDYPPEYWDRLVELEADHARQATLQ